MARVKGPLGPGGSWKQGQRCPTDGLWANQFGMVCDLEAHATFPPIRRKGACTYWWRYDEAA